MSVKIRLQRHGKKGKPYYWIVAADSRSKRDGKYLDYWENGLMREEITYKKGKIIC